VNNAIQPIQAISAQAETQPATQKPKTTQAGGHLVIPEDTVKISTSAKQALVTNKLPAASAGGEHGGNSQ
jgi:hypothetical protein